LDFRYTTNKRQSPQIYRLYRLPVTQVVVLLLPPTPETVIETSFNIENTRHEYRVMRMWEENPEIFLNDEALLPLAPLAATKQPPILLQQVVERVNQLAVEKRAEISAYTQILAGLKYKKELIRQLFREGIVRESVIYQEILSEGLQEGEQRGEQRGREMEGITARGASTPRNSIFGTIRKSGRSVTRFSGNGRFRSVV
jgi:predicted transposase YdaD